MPQTEVYYFRESDGRVPVLDWLLDLRAKNERAFRKCFELVRLLQQFGSELRRPRADYLRDGVYELRTRIGNVNYRILYGFVGKDVTILACGLAKEKAVPDKEIDRAMTRIQQYKKSPVRHRLEVEDIPNVED
ncbi:MAG: type II toxin-antitoxin system RelE/ParE family toxin [Pirellulales bacterium]